MKVIEGDFGKEKEKSSAVYAMEAVFASLKDTKIGEIKAEEVVGFTLTIETMDSHFIAGDSADYWQLVGALEDAKMSLLLNKAASKAEGAFYDQPDE